MAFSTRGYFSARSSRARDGWPSMVPGGRFGGITCCATRQGVEYAARQLQYGQYELAILRRTLSGGLAFDGLTLPPCYWWRRHQDQAAATGQYAEAASKNGKGQLERIISASDARASPSECPRCLPTVETSHSTEARGPHQFRTRNNLIETQRTRSKSNKTTAKSTNLIGILPLITVWLKVERFPNRQLYQLCFGSEHCPTDARSIKHLGCRLAPGPHADSQLLVNLAAKGVRFVLFVRHSYPAAIPAL
jgi:hypothetical protein